MAAASKSTSSVGNSAVTAKTGESKKKSPGPEPSPTSDNAAKSSSTFGRLLILPIFIASTVVGAVIGAYLAAYILESEYQNIVAKLQSDHQAATLYTQSDYIKCQSHLSDGRKSNEEEMTKLKIYADRNERAFQNRVEYYLNETKWAYKVANEGLQKASSRLEMEVESHKSTQLELSQEVENHESTQLELSQANKRLQAIRNTVNESSRALEASENKRHETEGELQHLQRSLEASENKRRETEEQLQHLLSKLDATEDESNETERQLQHLQRELDAAEEELDRRDLERAECDKHHRNVLQCRESLKEALVDLANHGKSEECGDTKATAVQLAQVMKQKDSLSQQVRSLIETAEQRDAQLDEVDSRSKEIDQEREYWERKAKSIMEKIIFRGRKEVLEKFGPGPHHVKLTFGFESSPENESILLELAPLDSMPHTIHMFLKMVQEKMYAGGTFILSREHIIVGGPVDAHNKDNNHELEQRMLREGYFPHGVLLFKEYSSDHPHLPYTFGFNHIGGPIFYINLQDNTALHGPSHSEQDGFHEGEPCFARIIEGEDVIQRIQAMPRKEDDSLASSVYIVDSHVVTITL